MKYIKLSILLSSLCCTPLFAQDNKADTFTDYGKVISVKADYNHIVEPRERCRNEVVTETVPRTQTYNYSGTVANDIINNQNGVSTVNGTIVTEAPPEIRERTIQRCVTTEDRRTEQNGYIVEYEYKGKRFMTKAGAPPSTNRILLTVSVRPQFY